MAEDDFRQLVEETLRDYDPEIDLSSGSPAETKIVDRLAEYVAEDPFDTDIVTFINTRLTQEFDQLGAEESTAIQDLLVSPFRTLMEPIVREIDLMKKRQSVRNLSVHTDDSIDALLSNYFIDREEGDYAQGKVRVFYNAPRYVAFTADIRFYDGNGHNFYPNGDQFISQRQMLFNLIGDEYYFDVDLIAQNPGEEFNVAAGTITYVEGVTGVKRVTNPFAFQSGLERETNELYLSRVENFPTEAALNARRGILHVIQDNFPSVDQIEVVGYGDPEMERDTLTGGGYGPIAAVTDLVAPSISPVEDGDYDGYTDLIQDTSIDFPSVLGVTGEITDRAAVMLVWQDTLGSWHAEDYDIVEVVSTNVIKIDTKIDAASIGTLLVRFHSILLADIPGGFMFPYQTEVKDEVHIGGAIDIYVKDPTPSDETIDITLISDETYIHISDDAEIVSGDRYIHMKGTTPETVHSTTTNDLVVLGANQVRLTDIRPGATYYNIPQDLAPGDIIYLPTVGSYHRINQLDSSTYSAGLIAQLDSGPAGGPYPYEILKYDGSVSKGMVAYLVGGEPGAYRIYEATGWTDSVEGWLRLTVAYEFTVSAVGLGCRVYDDVEVELTEPKSIHIEDTDLSAVLGLTYVTSTSGHDFTALGVQKDDVLRILTGDNAGDYTITAITGAGNEVLHVDSAMPFTVPSQSYQVFTVVPAVNNPVLQVESMGLLDSSLQTTGVEVPIGQPLAGISSDFTNMSRGGRYTSANTRTGIFSDEIPSTFPGIVSTYLNLRITYPNLINTYSYGPVSVTLDSLGLEVFFPPAGAPYDSAAKIVSTINAAIGSIGGVYAVDIRNRVALRPFGDVFIEVIPAVAGPDAAPFLNWIVDVTKSNGIEFPSDPTLSGVNAASDYCYFTSGPNGGNTYTLESIDSTNFVVYLERTRAFLHPTDEGTVTLGFLSTGNVRFYFRDPTYFEVNQNTVYSVEDEGVTKQYIPDPTLKTTVYPEEDKAVANNFNVITVPYEVTIPALDAMIYLIETQMDDDGAGFIPKGDVLDVTYRKMWFNADVAAGIIWAFPASDPELNISVDGSSYREFRLQDIGASPLPLQDLVDAINAVFPDLAEIIHPSGFPAEDYLALDSEQEVKVTYNTDFLNAVSNGNAPTPGSTNRCASYGTYTILGLVPTTIDTFTVSNLTGTMVSEDENIGGGGPGYTAAPEPKVTIYRPGMQKLCTSVMADHTEYGYHYADMEFVSLGVGDQFNVPPDLYGETTGYRCYGYTLKNTNSALAFSTQEDLYAVLSSQILEQDVDCSPPNETLIAGRNIRVNYSRSPEADDIHTFVTADTERVINASVVAKHLIPAYVKGTLSYTGPVDEDNALTKVTDLIEGLGPEDRLEISDVSAVLTNLGANYVQTPVVLATLYQDVDRKMYVRFVEDTEELGRLVTFFVDTISLVRLSS